MGKTTMTTALHDIASIKGIRRSADAKVVLLVLSDACDDATRECSFSQDEIAGLANCSRWSVVQAVKMLEKSGCITRRKGEFGKTVYKITLPGNKSRAERDKNAQARPDDTVLFTVSVSRRKLANLLNSLN